MNYEIITLERMNITGVSVRTSNTDPEMMQKVGTLWGRMYEEGLISKITGRIGDQMYGLYTNYESDVNGSYDSVVGCETKRSDDQGAGMTTVVIPEGWYARFNFMVNMQEGGTGAAWQEVWNTELPRAYTADFEEYLPTKNPAETPLNIYIALQSNEMNNNNQNLQR